MGGMASLGDICLNQGEGEGTGVSGAGREVESAGGVVPGAGGRMAWERCFAFVFAVQPLARAHFTGPCR